MGEDSTGTSWARDEKHAVGAQVMDEQALDDAALRVREDGLTPFAAAQILDVAGAQAVNQAEQIGTCPDQPSEIAPVGDHGEGAHETNVMGSIAGTIPASAPSSRKR